MAISVIRLPQRPPIDVMHPVLGAPTLGTGVAAGALPKAVPATPIKLSMTAPTGDVIFDNRVTTKDAANKIVDILESEPKGTRNKILKELRRKLGEDRAKKQSEIREFEALIGRVEMERDALEAFQAAALELMRWQKAGLRLERPTGSVMHHLLDAMAEKRVRLLFAEAAGTPGDFKTGHLVGQGTHAFVVEHDWAGVFRSAKEFSGEDFKLPYDSMCFEFRISGKNICAMTTDNGDRKLMAPFVESTHGWVIPKYVYAQVGDSAWVPTTSKASSSSDEFDPLRALICEQIRAICIALDAEVSTTEVIRAPYRLNRSREKRGRAPIADYHVIKLAHRHRALPRPDDAEEELGTRKRLHFRRGHWRHYTNHRTWINWMLVGDPDLGFIDKHYRL